ncbi:MAG TPA: aminotransferase class III-fold pyridoxal phosphate-dependent enzyme [Gaiellaceae bacterium]|nr:aminotransferase class III-fold pyridoxal phosphate-dependent enzyme [Gaiellaceae bacterium]
MSVLETQPPAFTPDGAAEVAAKAFGLAGGAATDLGSERDQTFLIESPAGDAVLKISNTGEDPAVLDLEHEAILHALRVDPELPIARPLGRSVHGDHQVRLFERLHGRKGGPELDDDAVRAYAQTHARLNLALRSFFHPAAGRELLWDLARTPQLRPLLPSIADERRRALVERAIDRFEERVAPAWPRLRAQVVHGDLNTDNVLLDERHRIAGIVDFGDCSHSAQAADFAVALASLLRGRPVEDVFRVGRIAVDGYASRIPFEQLELDLLGDLVAARLAMIVAISAWRSARYPENAAYIQAWDDDSWTLLEHFDALGADAVARELGAAAPAVPTRELAARRDRAVGGILTGLTYAEPVHLARGEGVWLLGPGGERFLDSYNNVPVVGHCHPRVTEAVVRQTRALNTHARYLYEPLVELAERLLATMPAEAALDTVMLVNSGSEANDVAWRIAVGATGNRGAIVTEHAYHGVTDAIADLSPEEWPHGFRPASVATIAPPGSGADVAVELDRALGELDGLAVTMIDGAFTSDGVRVATRDEMAALVRRTHDAGGLFVADEVQAGHGRTGEHLWSFAAHGLVPDLVTLGKPMGNGYPVAAVVTRREILDRFAFAGTVFSTFGGNPVAARAALAVLDAIEDERLVVRAAAVGARLRERIAALGAPGVVEVRGRGQITGVELESPELAERVVNRLREERILIGRTGRRDDTLKIRPPLVSGDEHADLLVDALARALA